MNLPRYYDRKLIVSGNVAELYEYELPVSRSAPSKPVGRAGQTSTTEEQKRENRRKRAQRARQKVRRYANANFDNNSKFLTLTFKDNLTDLKAANRLFTCFIKRFNRFLRSSLQYISTPQPQKRGAIHYHLLMNCPYIPHKKISEIWGHGFIKINRIDNVDNVGAYVTRYMSHDFDDERFIGEKCYFMSRNLKKPEQTTNDELIDEVISTCDVERVAYTSSFNTDYFGEVRYTQLVMNERISLAEIRQQLQSQSNSQSVALVGVGNFPASRNKLYVNCNAQQSPSAFENISAPRAPFHL